MEDRDYYIYITTNPGKTMLYVGVTNCLSRRIQEHFENRGKKSSFAGKHYCYNLIYWEEFKYISDAIAREKEVKKWNRKKKEALIHSFNPQWHSYNRWAFEAEL